MGLYREIYDVTWKNYGLFLQKNLRINFTYNVNLSYFFIMKKLTVFFGKNYGLFTREKLRAFFTVNFTYIFFFLQCKFLRTFYNVNLSYLFYTFGKNYGLFGKNYALFTMKKLRTFLQGKTIKEL